MEMKLSMKIPTNPACRILVFGPQAFKLQANEALVSNVEFPIRASDMIAELVRQYPALEPSIAVSRLAVNQEFAAPESLIEADDEVALIGLISGG